MHFLLYFLTPISIGYAFSHLAKPIHISGSDITEYLHEFYTQKMGLDGTEEHSISTEISNSIKERHGALRKVADETVFESSLTDPVYELPDGTSLNIAEERFNCAECLFDPAVIASMIPTKSEDYTSGFSKTLFDTVSSCAEEIREEIYGGIILSGGNTLFEGVADRIKQDLVSWIKNDVDTFQSTSNINVIDNRNRQHAAWDGGSLVASMWSTFKRQIITRSEYDELGASIVKSKCIR